MTSSAAALALHAAASTSLAFSTSWMALVAWSRASFWSLAASAAAIFAAAASLLAASTVAAAPCARLRCSAASVSADWIALRGNKHGATRLWRLASGTRDDKPRSSPGGASELPPSARGCAHLAALAAASAAWALVDSRSFLSALMDAASLSAASFALQAAGRELCLSGPTVRSPEQGSSALETLRAAALELIVAPGLGGLELLRQLCLSGGGSLAHWGGSRGDAPPSGLAL